MMRRKVVAAAVLVALGLGGTACAVAGPLTTEFQQLQQEEARIQQDAGSGTAPTVSISVPTPLSGSAAEQTAEDETQSAAQNAAGGGSTGQQVASDSTSSHLNSSEADMLANTAEQASSASVSADEQALQSVNAEIQATARNWPQIAAAAQSYGALANYASESGIGPVVRNEMDEREQCHNAYWDNEIPQLVTGAMNIAGDAEAQAYAIQSIATAWAQDAGNLLDAQVQRDARAQNPNFSAVQSEVTQEVAAANALNGMLNSVTNQIVAATGPNSTLQPLPISNWQVAVGDYPNLSAVQWNAGPADGAPIGWYLDETPGFRGFARLVDVCPTGTASIPMESDATTISAMQMAEQEELGLAQEIPALPSGSTWSSNSIWDSYEAADYRWRVQLVQTLANDMPRIAGYMSPVTGAFQSFAQTANQLTQSLSASGQ